jgi:isocitrate lyase
VAQECKTYKPTMRRHRMPNAEAILETIEKKRIESTKTTFSAEDVEKLRGTFNVEYTVSKQLSKKLWKLLNTEKYINTLGGLSGNHAVQHAKAGLRAIYLSGWQVAADANSAGEMYPDQSLYPYDSAPKLVENMINALMRADQIQYMEILEGKMNPKDSVDYHMPIIADGEAGFGGPLNVYELTKKFIKAGAAGVHFEDQLAAEKKCGHMGGKVLIPTQNAIRNLKAARLAANVMNVPLVILARTDANAAKLITSDCDANDKPFLTGERSAEGFYYVKNGIDQAIARGLAYAPYCDLIWCETDKPDLAEAKKFAEAIHAKFPGKLLAYNCSPSFNWKKYLTESEMQTFQQKLGDMGYKFQFITLAGFHVQNYSVFTFAQNYKKDGMAAYSKIQQQEFEAEKDGYTAVKHQREVGASYFDNISQIISAGQSSTTAMSGSTESEQF